MRKYSVIVFDLGNVLLPFDYSKVIDNLNRLKPNLGDRFSRRYQENYHIHRNFESGKITRDDFLITMIDWLENSVDKDTFCKLFSDIFTLNEKMISLLPKLKENYKIVLLSNTNEIHQEYGYKNYSFLNYFDKLFLSHEIGAVKPEEKIYRAVEEYTQKTSKEHLFIDDIVGYVSSARKYGWDAILFTNYENLIKEFNIRNVL